MIYYRTKDYVIKAAVDKSGGIMIALQVPIEVADKLTVEGGQPASDLHVTLVYLGKADEIDPKKMQTLHDIVSSITSETPPIEVSIIGYGVFPKTDDGPCLYAEVGLSSQIESLRETFVEAVSSYGMPPQGRGADGPYKPHITLAYGQSAPPPEVVPVNMFTANWIRSTFGGTEGLFRLKGAAQSEMMKAIFKEFDESQHPRDEGGKFTEGGGGKIYMKPSDVMEESSWGGKKQYVIRDPKTGQGSGRLIDRPLKDEEIPDTLYHTTVNLPGVQSSSHLLGQSDGGGMGGGNNMAGVSFTSSKADADLMKTELQRMHEITAAAPEKAEDVKAMLTGYARADEKASGLKTGALDPAVDFAMYNWEGNKGSRGKDWNGKDWDTSPNLTGEKWTQAWQEGGKEALNQYHQLRGSKGAEAFGNPKDFDTNDKYAMLKNPHIFGDAPSFAKMNPEHIGIISLPKANLPKEALIREGTDAYLHEIRVHADVPLAGHRVEKDGEGGSGLTTPADGAGTPLWSYSKNPRKKPIDGQVYTAFTPDGSLGTVPSPGIFKEDGAPAGMASDPTAAFGTPDLDRGGRLAPGQGIWRKPRKGESKWTGKTDAVGGSGSEILEGRGETMRHVVDGDEYYKKDGFGGGQSQGQGLAVATAPEYTKRPTKPEFKSIADSGKAVAIDFDATITLDEKKTENPEMRKLVDDLLAHNVRVVIFSARPADQIHAWLKEHNWPSLEVTNVKSHDFGVFLDDKAVNFTPDMAGDALAGKLLGFKAWWEKFLGAVGPRFEDKDRNGDLKKADPTTDSNMGVSTVPLPEMSDDREDKLRAEQGKKGPAEKGTWEAPKPGDNNAPIASMGRNPENHHDPKMRRNEPFTPPEGIQQPMALAAYRTPAIQRTVDMIENGVLVVRHVFYGDDEAKAKHIEDAHRAADGSLDASMKGKPYKDVDIEAVRKATPPTVILARHGSTDFNSGQGEGGARIRGWINVPLNAEGRADAKKLAKAIAAKFPKVDEIYSSDLSRAYDTAEQIAAATGKPEIVKTRKLRPWDLGDYNGKPIENIKDKLDELVTNYQEQAPNGESLEDFMDRFCPFLQGALDRAKITNKVIVLVAHTRNVRAADAWCDREKMTPERMMGPNDITEPGEYVVMQPADGDKWSFKVQAEKAHDAGVQPNAEDKKPKFPATAVVREG